MAVVHIRVTNALNGQELLPETAFSGSELQEQVLAALGSRPSLPVTLLQDGAVVEELRALPGDCLDLTAVLGQALSVDERERHVQQLQDAGRHGARDIFATLSEAARDDAAVVLAAVQVDAACLYHATELCKKDQAIVRAAMRQAVQQNLDLLRLAALAGTGKDYNKEIMIAAVQQHPCNLQYASRNCKEDKDVVLAAVRTDGRALQHAARSCRQDKDIVLAAVQQNSRAFAWAGPLCEKDDDIRRAADL